MRFTVFGSSGFIGSHVARQATQLGHEVTCVPRDSNMRGSACGHVIYCIGMTSGFRYKPHQTIDAHVVRLQQILKEARFETFTYLSSTRVYQRCAAPVASESSPVIVHPQDPEDLYNLSKLVGESLLLQFGDGVRVARLSNVVGDDPLSDNFLFSVLRDCVQNGRVLLRQQLDSAKDYVHVDDVAKLLLRLGPEGRSRVYNVASGVNTTHRQIRDAVMALTGAAFDVSADAVRQRFPQINIERIKEEFQFQARDMLAHLPSMLHCTQSHQRNIP